MEEPAKTVTPGSIWQHYNGGIYTVLEILNPDNPPDDDKPPTVAYIGTNGRKWARRLDDWGRSFRPAELKGSVWPINYQPPAKL